MGQSGLDVTELLEGLILALLIIELVELGYHIYKIRGYEKKIDQHLTKMDTHIAAMEQHIHELKTEMAKRDKLTEKSQ